MLDNFSVTNKTRQNMPSLPFLKIKNKILGKNYEVSLVFIGEKKAQNLNKKYRSKEYSPNILSFPLDKNIGEIFINLKRAKKESHDFKKKQKDFLVQLFVHSLLHLKGFKHGKKMEVEEDKYVKFLKK